MRSYNAYGNCVSYGKERENKAETNFEEIIVENFPKLIKSIKPQILKAQWNTKQNKRNSHCNG